MWLFFIYLYVSLAAVGLDEPLQRLHTQMHGGAGVLGHVLIQTCGLPLLIPDHMEARAAPAAQRVGHHKQRRRLHLAGLHAQPLPRLPLVQQLIGHGHPRRTVLAVKRVLALHHAGVVAVSAGLGRRHQSAGDLEIRHGGVLDGGVLLTGMFKPDGAGGNDHVAGLHVQVNAAAGAHADEGVGADVVQLLHGDGGRGAADAGGADGDLFAQQGAGVDGELAVAGHKLRVIKQRGNGLAPPGVSGEDAVAPHVALLAVNMKLFFQFLHKSRLLL